MNIRPQGTFYFGDIDDVAVIPQEIAEKLFNDVPSNIKRENEV